MYSIGIVSAVLFLASLTAFLFGFYYIDYYKPLTLLGLALFVAAGFIIAVQIRRRTPTEMN